MIEENDNDGKILKDVFLKSLELSDPVKKLEKIKRVSPCLEYPVQSVNL